MSKKQICIPQDLYESIGFLTQDGESMQEALERLLIEAVQCKLSLYRAKVDAANALLNRCQKAKEEGEVDNRKEKVVPDALTHVVGSCHKAKFDQSRETTDEN